MSNLSWLTEEQMSWLETYFPKSHVKKRVDDRRVLNGIIFVIRNDLHWRDAQQYSLQPSPSLLQHSSGYEA